MPFSDLDDDFGTVPLPGESRKRAEVTPAQFACLPAMQIPSGYFTLTLTDGSRKRFRVRLERGSFLTGKRTLARYCKIEADDDAEREWESIAVIEHDGFSVFKRWLNTYEHQWAIQLWCLLNAADETCVRAAPGYSVEVEKRCHLCMRQLTSDEQRACGLTPSCAKKVR